MKYIFIFFFTTSLYSQIPFSNIQSFNGNYNNGNGTANAVFFQFADMNFTNNPSFELYKQANTFYLSTPDQSVELNMLPEKVHELETLIIENLNLKSNESSLEVNIEKIKGDSIDKHLMAMYLSLRCHNPNKDFILGILNTCLNNQAHGTLSNIDIDGSSYKDIDLSITNHKLSFRLKIAGIGAKGDGEIAFSEVHNKVVIKIDKVKAGFFNVTKKFFDEIKKIESETVIINQPYIEVLLD